MASDFTQVVDGVVGVHRMEEREGGGDGGRHGICSYSILSSF